MKYLILIAVLLSFAVPVKAELTIRGALDCGTWLEARRAGLVRAEGWLVGVLNGVTIGSGIEFWQAGDGMITNDQLFYWMDKYCRENPLNDVMDGVGKLFNERTGD